MKTILTTTNGFTLDGVSYPANFVAVKRDGGVALVWATNPDKYLMKPTAYTDLTINGSVPTDINAALSALASITFKKGGDGGSIDPAVLAQIQQNTDDIEDLDPDTEKSTSTAAAFDEDVLPAADKGDYIRITTKGTITLNGTDHDVKVGDRIRCTTDATAANIKANWEYQQRHQTIPNEAKLRELGINIDELVLTTDFTFDISNTGFNAKLYVLNSRTQTKLFEWELPTAVFGAFRQFAGIPLWDNSAGSTNNLFITGHNNVDPNNAATNVKVFKLSGVVIDIENEQLVWNEIEEVLLNNTYDAYTLDEDYITYINNNNTELTRVNRDGKLQVETFELPYPTNVQFGNVRIESDENCYYIMAEFGPSGSFEGAFYMARKSDPVGTFQEVFNFEADTTGYPTAFEIDYINREIIFALSTVVGAGASFQQPSIHLKKYNLDTFEFKGENTFDMMTDASTTNPYKSRVVWMVMRKRKLYVLCDRNPQLFVVNPYNLTPENSIDLSDEFGNGASVTVAANQFYGGTEERGYLRCFPYRAGNNELIISITANEHKFGFFNLSTESVEGVTTDGNAFNYTVYLDRGPTYPPRQEAVSGLRGVPVATIAALTALTARDYELRKVEDDGSGSEIEVVFSLGATSGLYADDAATGFWNINPVVVTFPKINAPTADVNITLDDTLPLGSAVGYEIGDTTNKIFAITSNGGTVEGVTQYTASNHGSGKKIYFVHSEQDAWTVAPFGDNDEDVTNLLYLFEGAWDNLDPTNADNEFEQLNLDDAITASDYGVAIENQFDPNGWRNGNGLDIEGGTTGRWIRVLHEVHHPVAEIIGGTANVQNGEGVMTAWLRWQDGEDTYELQNTEISDGRSGTPGSAFIIREFHIPENETRFLQVGFDFTADQGSGDFEDLWARFQIIDIAPTVKTIPVGSVVPEDNLKFKYEIEQSTDIVADTGTGGNTTSYTDTDATVIPLLNTNITKNIGNLFQIDEANNALEFLQDVQGDLVIEVDAFDEGGSSTTMFNLYVGDLTNVLKENSKFLRTNGNATVRIEFKDRSWSVGQKLDLRFGNHAGEDTSVRGIKIYFENQRKDYALPDALEVGDNETVIFPQTSIATGSINAIVGFADWDEVFNTFNKLRMIVMNPTNKSVFYDKEWDLSLLNLDATENIFYTQGVDGVQALIRSIVSGGNTFEYQRAGATAHNVELRGVKSQKTVLQDAEENRTFSFTEVDTLRDWVNGKRIYRRCFDMTGFVNGNIILTNVEDVIDAGGTLFITALSSSLKVPFASGAAPFGDGDDFVTYDLKTNGNLLFHLGVNGSVNTNPVTSGNIWIEYTKQ